MLAADAAYKAPVLEVEATPSAGRRRHPPAQRSAEQRQGFVHLDDAMVVDLVGLERDRLQALVAERAAVEQKSDPPWAGRTVRAPRPRPRRQEVDADEPTVLDFKAALLERFAPACIPGRLAVGLDLSTGDRPAALVIGFQDQQPSRFVEDQGAGRGRDPGEVWAGVYRGWIWRACCRQSRSVSTSMRPDLAASESAA